MCLACPPGSRSTVRCRGSVVVRCDADGGSEESICGGDTPACLDGACAACVPGGTRCRARCLESCSAAGSWNAPAACAACPPPSGRVLAAGRSHACASLASGAVVCWGGNDHGQLGLGHAHVVGDSPGDLPGRLAPVALGSGARAVDIAAGGRHTCVVFDTGQVKCWGDNGSGQLGLGDTNHRSDEPGELGDALPAVDLGKNRTAVSVAAGGTHTCALLDDGSVKCWGGNTRGQLGIGDNIARGDDPCEMGDDLPAVNLGGARATLVVAARCTAAHCSRTEPRAAGGRTVAASSASATRRTTHGRRSSTSSRAPRSSRRGSPRWPRAIRSPARCSRAGDRAAGAMAPPVSSATASPPA